MRKFTELEHTDVSDSDFSKLSELLISFSKQMKKKVIDSPVSEFYDVQLKIAIRN